MADDVAVAVSVGVRVGVRVEVGVAVRVGVRVEVAVFVAVAVAVPVLVPVGVGGAVEVGLDRGDGDEFGVDVADGLGELVAVCVDVVVGVEVVVGEGVPVGVAGGGQHPVPQVHDSPPFPQSTEPSPPVPPKVSCWQVVLPTGAPPEQESVQEFVSLQVTGVSPGPQLGGGGWVHSGVGVADGVGAIVGDLDGRTVGEPEGVVVGLTVGVELATGVVAREGRGDAVGFGVEASAPGAVAVKNTAARTTAGNIERITLETSDFLNQPPVN